MGHAKRACNGDVYAVCLCERLSPFSVREAVKSSYPEEGSGTT
jgi:hypothetical protein